MPVAHLMAKKMVEVSQPGLVRKPPAGVPVKCARKLPLGLQQGLLGSHTLENSPNLLEGVKHWFLAHHWPESHPPLHHRSKKKSTGTKKRSPLFM